MNPHIYGQMIFNKTVKAIQWGKSSLLALEKLPFGIRKTEHPYAKNKVEPLLYTIYKNQPNWLSND